MEGVLGHGTQENVIGGRDRAVAGLGLTGTGEAEGEKGVVDEAERGQVFLQSPTIC